MKIDVYAHPDYRFEAERMVEEGKKLGIETELVLYSEFRTVLDNEGLKIYRNGKRFEIGDGVIFRTASYKQKAKYRQVAKIIRTEYERRGKYIFNWDIMKNKIFDKFSQQAIFAGGDLPYIKSYYFQTREGLLEEKLEYPFVAKPLNSSHGVGVVKIDTSDDLEEYLNNNNIKETIFQELMEEGRDWRVIVLGGKVLGGLERSAEKGKFVNNISDGGIGRRVEIDMRGLEIAIEAARISGAEYAGVDLIKDKQGKWRMMELNRFAEFRGFEKYTGVNVAGDIMKYVVSKIDL